MPLSERMDHRQVIVRRCQVWWVSGVALSSWVSPSSFGPLLMRWWRMRCRGGKSAQSCLFRYGLFSRRARCNLISCWWVNLTHSLTNATYAIADLSLHLVCIQMYIHTHVYNFTIYNIQYINLIMNLWVIMTHMILWPSIKIALKSPHTSQNVSRYYNGQDVLSRLSVTSSMCRLLNKAPLMRKWRNHSAKA